MAPFPRGARPSGPASAKATPTLSAQVAAPIAAHAAGLASPIASAPNAGLHGHIFAGLVKSPSRTGSPALVVPSASPTPSVETVVSLATDGALADYICQSPLLASCNITPEEVKSHIMQWRKLGVQLASQLGFEHDDMDDIQRLRVYHYYLPVFFWVEKQLAAHRTSGAKHALVVGISAPQGCGKTTLVEQLEALYTATGRTAASVSIDDFYLTYQDQTALGQAHPGNPLLQYRGNAGSHDLKLGTDTLKQLRELTQPGQQLAVPRYNKSAYAGRGDRADPSAWPSVPGPVDVVLFEGWMSGFEPVSDEQVASVDPNLVPVNQALRAYKAAWDDWVDAWLVVRIGDPQWVFKWRLQAEERMRASGKAGMTDAQIADFVARFMPAYKAYLPGLYAKGPTTARAGKTLIIEVDEKRSPVVHQPAPVL